MERPNRVGKHTVSSINEQYVTLDGGGRFRNVGAYGDHYCLSLTTAQGDDSYLPQNAAVLYRKVHTCDDRYLSRCIPLVWSSLMSVWCSVD